MLDKETKQKLLRSLPSITFLLDQEGTRSLIEKYSHDLVVDAANMVLNRLREQIINDQVQADLMPVSKDALPGKAQSREEDAGYYIAAIARELKSRFAPHLKRVINATGVVLHTNLGRALLSESALEAVLGVGASYSNLELDLDTGERGSRYVHVEKLITELTGAEAAMVVNNNAAAVMLVLNTFAQGKEVIVSRGQLVEIGGSFRIPEVMRAGGAHLVEVGATNKTHLKDYREAINENTALLLKVHTSNYKIAGFTSEVALEDLVALGQEKGVPVVDDLGSGVLVDLSRYGLPAEPTVQESIRAGADIVTFSGDKLFGGPQAGVVAGKAKYIEAMKKNQLTRALRVDKMTFAALEATLKLYLDENQAVAEIPTLRMLSMNVETLTQRSRNFASKLKKALNKGRQEYEKLALIQVIDGYSQVGGGALPTADLPTKLVALEPQKVSVTRLESWLRTAADQPVLVRVQKNQVLIDLRTVQPKEEGELILMLAESILEGGF